MDQSHANHSVGERRSLGVGNAANPTATSCTRRTLVRAGRIAPGYRTSPPDTMETSALKFQQAYDDARAASIASLASVKDVYEGISRDLTSEFKALEGEKRDLAGGS